MMDGVRELAEKVIGVIDDKEKKWPSAEEKLAHLRSYLLGLCDGYDYAEAAKIKIDVASLGTPLTTCVKCGKKTTEPRLVLGRRGFYCPSCAKELTGKVEGGS